MAVPRQAFFDSPYGHGASPQEACQGCRRTAASDPPPSYKMLTTLPIDVSPRGDAIEPGTVLDEATDPSNCGCHHLLSVPSIVALTATAIPSWRGILVAWAWRVGTGGTVERRVGCWIE
jgi:hypothetical protein